MHPEIDKIVEGLVARKKYIYLCTNALLLKEKLHLFKPSKYLTFSVHVDGEKEHHDFSVCKEGGFDLAVEGIREAIARGFRVTTNTTLFDGADPNSVRDFFDQMMDLGVEGMMLSPGYSYDKAPDQQHFLGRARTRRLFRAILSNRSARWKFNMSPLFLEFLMGKRHYTCTPWGMPTYNLFGWQKPCYLLQDGYADTFAELMESTKWENYGTESGNPKCANCMVHSGYEASAVHDQFNSLGGFLATVKGTLFTRYRDPEALKMLQAASQARSCASRTGATQRRDRIPRRGRSLNAEELEVVPGFEHENLQGRAWEPSSEEELREGIEKAFDYRGDVTILRTDGSEVEGYIFDRRVGATLSESFVRLFPKGDAKKLAIPYSDIASLQVHGSRHRGRQKLGSVAQEILGKEGGRREEHRAKARKTGLRRYRNFHARHFKLQRHRRNICPDRGGHVLHKRQGRHHEIPWSLVLLPPFACDRRKRSRIFLADVLGDRDVRMIRKRLFVSECPPIQSAVELTKLLHPLRDAEVDHMRLLEYFDLPESNAKRRHAFRICRNLSHRFA